MKMTIDPHRPGEIKVRDDKRRRKPRYEQTAALAYNFYEQDGRPEGKDLEHWFKAESIISKEDKPSHSQ